MSQFDSFLRFATTLYGLLTLAALALTLVAFWYSARARAALDAAIDGGGDVQRKSLRLFDLSHGDVAKTLGKRRLVEPELLWTYDEAYLERFAQAAMHAQIKGRPALRYYVQVILRRFDVPLAVGLGAFAILVDLALFAVLSADYPVWSRAAFIGACMGLVYMAADIAEDLKLATILGHVVKPRDDKAAQIDPGEAAAANMLTRVKIVTLVLSGVGVVVVLVLSAVAAIFFRPPKAPVPEPEPAPAHAD
jgi:hypothetical protein